MRYEWNEDKSLANRITHGIGFDAIAKFEWETALEFIDDREDYGELREVAIGFIGVRLHYLIFTRSGDVIRVISLRRATNKEKRRYVEES
jgi:uncharacterized DUF497 family protein